MRTVLLLLLSVVQVILITCLALAQEKPIVGWVEKVKIVPGDAVLHAKLDTGADYSSLSAEKITELEKDKEKWVKFTVVNRYGDKIEIEKRVRRIATIKRHSGAPDKRAVIRLGVCVGTTYMEEDVNLVDRTNFDYQLLIGRSFLAGNVIVDPAVTYTSEPNCKGIPKS